MFVGCLRLTLTLAENGSLKGKRALVRRVRDRLRARFNLAVAEVDTQDVWQVATLAVVCVSNERAHAHTMLMNALHFLERMRLDAEISDVETEILQGP